MIRYGTNPIAWANDDDRTLGAHIPTETILSEAAAIGFDGIEDGHRFPADPQALKALFAPHGLALVSAWSSLDLLELDVAAQKAALQPGLDRLKAMGCAVVIAAETSSTVHGSPDTPLSHRQVLDEAAMRAYGAKLEEIAAFTAAQGLPLVYHPHMGTIVQSPEDLDRLMDATGPATRLLFDTGHYHFGSGGQDPAPAMARHAARIAHVHAKNVRPAVMRQALAEDWSFLRAVRAGVFTVPGDPEGGIDFAPCLAVLAEAGYDGWLVIEAEQDPEARAPQRYQSLGLETLRGLARAAGLDRAAA